MNKIYIIVSSSLRLICINYMTNDLSTGIVLFFPLQPVVFRGMIEPVVSIINIILFNLFINNINISIIIINKVNKNGNIKF